MTNMSKQHSQCALCGKTIVNVQEQEPSMLKEIIVGICYTFDTNECVLMFKRFRSVYGDQRHKNNLFLTIFGIGQFPLNKK